MRLLFDLIKTYPWRTFFALVTILFAGIADGASISALLPLLRLVTSGQTPGSDEMVPESSEEMSSVEAMVVNTLASVGLEPTLGVLLVFVVAGVTVKSLLLLLADKHVGYSSAHITTDLRLGLLRAVLATRWDYFLHQPIGRLANSMATEAKRSAQSYVFGITMLTMFIQAMVYAAIAVAMSWKATLMVFGVGIAILAMSHLLVRMSRRAGKKQTKLFKSLLTRLTDTLQSVKSLKAMAREELADSVLSTETSKLNRALQREVLSQAILAAIQAPLFAIVIATGIYVALEKMGMQFATVMVMVVLLSRILTQMGKMQKQYQKMISKESAYWSIQKAIKQAKSAREISSGSAEPKLESGIRLDNVSFAYGDKPVLQGISLRIRTRALTTIIGASGGGKTTLVDLIIGLYEPDSGTVYLDDVPLTQVDLKLWRQQIGYVPQEQILLHDSILTNVTFGDPQLTEADAEQALEAAGAWEFTKELPQGIHSSVGERGSKLSGGQRQRIMIARALAHRPRVLILDEPTSALDPASEAIISSTLQKLRKDFTILAISHQDALVDSADEVYRLQDGQLTQDS
jgi:ATP-binding cassette subfamily C protein